MGVPYYGDFPAGATVYIPFNTFTSDDPSASVTMTNFINTDVHIHKNLGLTQRNNAAGITVDVDVDAIAGCHGITIVTSDNTVANFFTSGADYQVRVEGVTVDAATLNPFVGSFSIENRMVAGYLVATTIATLASQTSFTLTAGSADNDAYNGCLAIVTDLTTAVQKCLGLISDYTGGTKTITLAANPGIFTMAQYDQIAIVASSALANVKAVNGTLQTANDNGADINEILTDTGTTLQGEMDAIQAAVITNAAGVDIAADIIAVKAETALIVADTNELQTDDYPTSIAAIKAETALIVADTNELQTDDYPTSIAAIKAETALIVADTNELQTDDYPNRFTTIETLINDIGSGSAGISIKAESSVETVAGAPTNTYAVTDQLDGVYHIVPDDGADDTDMYYQFDIGTTGIPIEVEWVGYAQGNNATYLVYFYNWVTTSWDQVYALIGTPGTTEQTHAFSATIEHVGTGGDVGKVRLRFLSTDGAVVATDFILCDYAIDNTTSISSILVDTNELQTDWADAGRLDLILDIIAADTTTDIPALIATAQADLDIITDADGTILGAAAIAAIWDATEAITGQTHSFEYIMAWVYRFFFNKMIVTDANGNIALRNEADGADIATGNVIDNATLTTRAALTIL